jgi:hypothetical protein
MPGKLARLFNLYAQFFHNCENTETTRRIIADASLSIFNNPYEMKKFLTKMQTDLADKGVKCDPLKPDHRFVLESVNYEVEEGGLRVGIKYKFAYRSAIGKENQIKMKADVPATIYTTLVSQASKAKVIRLIAYYTLLGLNTGQFWGLVPAFYGAINRKYGQRAVECFASPFNHTLTNYYSPLTVIEKQYGSVGSFFMNFLPDNKYSTYIINPPFVEDILKIVFNQIVIKLEFDRPIEIIIYLPNWKDLTDLLVKNIQAVAKSTKTFILPKNRSIVYDYTKQHSFTARFETIVIMASNKSFVDESFFRNLVGTMLLK